MSKFLKRLGAAFIGGSIAALTTYTVVPGQVDAKALGIIALVGGLKSVGFLVTKETSDK